MAVVIPFPVAFRSTVVALPSLDSVLSLALRVIRVPGLEAGPLGATVAVRFVRAAAAPPELELEFEVVVTFLTPPTRFPGVLSARLVAVVGRELPVFKGELDLDRYDLVGDVARLRFANRELDEVGDKTCAGRTSPALEPRALFLRCSPI